MDYQVSARKYRPGTFQDVIGQPHVITTLVNAIASHRVAHAFLFSGSRGVGKTTVARILAKALNCEQGPTRTPCDHCANCLEISQGNSVDVVEIDGASNTSVDDVREIRENVKFTPFRGHYRVYIIDEVHMLSNSAFNALLKTLEEPPSHVVFIFATTEIHKIPATILSRCQHYTFRRIPRTEMLQRLRYVAEQDGIHVEDRSLASIARASEGSMRDALSLMDQAVSFGGKTINHGDLEALLGAVPQELVRTMVTAIRNHDAPAAILVISQLLDQGHELRAFCANLVEHVRNLLVATVVTDRQELKAVVDLSDDEINQIVADVDGWTSDQLSELFRIFSQAEDALRLSARPRFVLEVAAIRATRLPSVPGGGETPRSPSPTGGEQARRPVSTASASATTLPERSRPVPARSKASSATAVRVSDSTVKRPNVADTAGLPTVSSSRSQPTPSTEPGHVAASPPVLQRKRDVMWEDVVERVGQQFPSIAPFLAMATSMALDGRHLKIGYPKTASVALARIQKPDVLAQVAGAYHTLTGQEVEVQALELTDGEPSGPSLAERRAAKERTQKQWLLEQTRAHPVVKQALAVFGGEVVDVRETVPREETP